MKRKHHCRACGAVVCDHHSNGRIVLPNVHPTERQRVCDTCLINPPSVVTQPKTTITNNNNDINNNTTRKLTTHGSFYNAATSNTVTSPNKTTNNNVSTPIVTTTNAPVITKTNIFSFTNPLGSRPLSMPWNPPPPIPVVTNTVTTNTTNNVVIPTIIPPTPPIVTTTQVIETSNEINQSIPIKTKSIEVNEEIKVEEIKNDNIEENKSENNIEKTLELKLQSMDSNSSNNNNNTNEIITPPTIKPSFLNSIANGGLEKQLKSIENTTEKPKLGFLNDISSGGLTKQLKNVSVSNNNNNTLNNSNTFNASDNTTITTNNKSNSSIRSVGAPQLSFLGEIQKGTSGLKKVTTADIIPPKTQQPTGLMGMLAMKMAQRRDNLKEDSDEESVRSGFSSDSD